jgi:hypothetical protein
MRSVNGRTTIAGTANIRHLVFCANCNCHNFLTSNFWGPSQRELGRSQKALRELPQWKTNFDFYVFFGAVIHV